MGKGGNGRREVKDRLLRVAEVADRLGLGESTVRRMLAQKMLPVTLTGPGGASVRVAESAVEEYVRRQADAGRGGEA